MSRLDSILEFNMTCQDAGGRRASHHVSCVPPRTHLPTCPGNQQRTSHLRCNALRVGEEVRSTPARGRAFLEARW